MYVVLIDERVCTVVLLLVFGFGCYWCGLIDGRSEFEEVDADAEEEPQ